jgi:type II secretory pathway component PulM
MLGSNDFQEEAIAKEEARIRYKREQNEIRRQRFQNARLRTIGLDVEALDAQVQEKVKNKGDRDEVIRLDSKLTHLSC